MKRSELKKQIEEAIIETLSEDLSATEMAAKKSATASAQDKVKASTAQLQASKTPLDKKAAQDALALAKEKLAQANAMR
jgi:hypothetical protein